MPGTLLKKINKKDLLSKAYQGLYRLHSMIESDSAKYYLDKVAFYSKGSTDLSEHFKVNNNFFKYHFGRKEYQLAKFFSRKSLEIAESSKNKQQIAIGKINYALCLMEGDKNYQETIKIYKEVLKLYPNNEDHKMFHNAF